MEAAKLVGQTISPIFPPTKYPEASFAIEIHLGLPHSHRRNDDPNIYHLLAKNVMSTEKIAFDVLHFLLHVSTPVAFERLVLSTGEELDLRVDATEDERRADFLNPAILEALARIDYANRPFRIHAKTIGDIFDDH